MNASKISFAISLFISASGILLTALVFARPSNPTVLPFYQRLSDPQLFHLDLEIVNSIIPQNSMFLSLMSFVGISFLSSADFAIASFVTLLLINIIILIGISRKVFPHIDGARLPILILMLMVANGTFADFHKISILPQTGTPTSFAETARLLFVYALLSNRNFLAVALLSVITFFSLKTAWPAFLIFLFFHAITFAKTRNMPAQAGQLALTLVLALLPALLYKAMNGAGIGEICPECAVEIYENVKASHPSEDLPYYLSFLDVFFFLFASGIALALSKGALKSLVYAAIGLNVVIFTFGSAYFLFFDGILHSTSLIYMSPMRGYEMGGLVVYLAAVGGIIQTRGLNNLVAASVLLAIGSYKSLGGLFEQLAILGLVSALIFYLSGIALERASISRSKAYQAILNGRSFSLLTLSFAAMMPALLNFYYFRIPENHVLSNGVLAPTEVPNLTFDDNRRFLLVQNLRGEWRIESNWNKFLGLSSATGWLYYINDVEVSRRIQVMNANADVVIGTLNGVASPTDSVCQDLANDLVSLVSVTSFGSICGHQPSHTINNGTGIFRIDF